MQQFYFCGSDRQQFFEFFETLLQKSEKILSFGCLELKLVFENIGIFATLNQFETEIYSICKIQAVKYSSWFFFIIFAAQDYILALLYKNRVFAHLHFANRIYFSLKLVQLNARINFKNTKSLSITLFFLPGFTIIIVVAPTRKNTSNHSSLNSSWNNFI